MGCGDTGTGIEGHRQAHRDIGTEKYREKYRDTGIWMMHEGSRDEMQML